MRMAIVLELPLALSAQAPCCPKSHLPFRKSADTPLTWMVSTVWLGVTWLRPGGPAKASSQQTAFNAARHAFTTPKEGVGAGA